MPSPVTTDDFIEVVRKTGVLDAKHLDAYLSKLRAASALPGTPAQLASLMLRDGLLTKFQTEQVLQGKWRRFQLGKYKILERLGAGGMGSVYLCEHKIMRRRVAVKVLPTSRANDASAIERFYREARAVAAFDHPNIVHAYDVDHEDNIHFLVMEYIDGASLQEIVGRTGPLDPIRAAHYIRQAAIGLEHAHQTAGLIHRDIKPGNILVDRNGVVKLLDLGLARFFNDEDDMLTKKYDENVLGTADYLAPEQVTDSHQVDIRADIYSLGGTFYFCLTGRSPFGEGTIAQKLIWHQTRQPKPIRTYRSGVPDEIVAIVDRMLAKDREQRYQTPQAVIDALEPFTRTPIPPPPEAEMPRYCPAITGGSGLRCQTQVGDEGAAQIGYRAEEPTNTGGLTPTTRRPQKSWQVSGTPKSHPPMRTASSQSPCPRDHKDRDEGTGPADSSSVVLHPAPAAAAGTAAVGFHAGPQIDVKPTAFAPFKPAAATKAQSAEPTKTDEPVPATQAAADTVKPTAKADTEPQPIIRPVTARAGKTRSEMSPSRPVRRRKARRQRRSRWPGWVFLLIGLGTTLLVATLLATLLVLLRH